MARNENGLHSVMKQLRQPAIREWFARFSRVAAAAVGSYWAFIAAGALVLIWAAAGPIFHFSDTWQLVINTTSSIVTFLMVFLIQSTQNRDTKAIHLKLDELIRAVEGARNDLVLLEDMSEEGLDDLASQFAQLRDRTCKARERKLARGSAAPESRDEFGRSVQAGNVGVTEK